MSDEILVKGKDGKWYVLKGGELLPYEQKTEDTRLSDGQGKQKTPVPEQSSVRGTAEIIQPVSPPSSVLRPPVPPIPPKPPVSFSHEGHPLRVELDELTAQVLQDSKLDFADPVLQKRFKTIVSARLRDVRDSAETKAMLLRDQKIGGMEMNRGQAIVDRDQATTASGLVTDVMEVIEKAFAEFQNKWQAVEKKRIEEWKKSQRAQRDQQDQQEQAKEQEELKKRYDRLTGGNPKQIPKPAPFSNNFPLLSNGNPVAQQREKATPPPPIRPPSSVLRPPSKITDVRPAQRLVGPIEELSSIALNDFRRIAATPQAGTDKIISKIDFLSKESLTRRTAGIKAWQASPLFKTYSKISAAALTGRCSPQSVLERFTTEGQSVLTLEEFYAIMDLNHRLRY